MPVKKGLVLTIASLLFITVAGIGAWAYFLDTESSAENQFSAGTLDLKTNDADGVTQTLFITSMKPGDTVGPETINLNNAGTIDGSALDIAFSYVESDGSPNLVDKSADDTAALMEVTTLIYGGSSLMGNVNDTNSNGYKDIEDLKNADLSGQSGLNAEATKGFEIAVRLKESMGDDFQTDGITVTITFTLNQ